MKTDEVHNKVEYDSSKQKNRVRKGKEKMVTSM